MTKSTLTQRIEQIILTNLIHNEDFTRKVIPFIKTEYFQDGVEKVVFETIWNYVENYKANPTIETLVIDVQKVVQNEEQHKACLEYIEKISPGNSDQEWLIKETEEWCKERAVYNAILNGIHIIDGKDKKRTPEVLPSILSEALAVSFDTNIGHDYTEQSEDRFEFYHAKEDKIPFD